MFQKINKKGFSLSCLQLIILSSVATGQLFAHKQPKN